MGDDHRPYGLVTDRAGRGAVYEGHGPQAVYDERTNTTYVAYRGPDADPYGTAYVHETGAFTAPVRIGENPLSPVDNHGPPSIVLDDDGYVIVFYGSHGGPHQVARSSEPYDVSAWDDLGEMGAVPGGTYPHPLLYDDDVYVLYRAGPSWSETTYPSAQYATIARSSDSGETFEDLGPLVDTTGHPDPISVTYVNSFSERDGLLHVSWLVCHDHAEPLTMASNHRSGIYHAAYDPAEDVLYGLDGTRFDRPITWDAYSGSVVEVFGGMDVNHPKHVHTEDGPAILYTHYDPPSLPSQGDDHRIEWLVSFWRGGWHTKRIAGAHATHLFDGGYPRINDDGEFEAHVITGGSDERLADGARGGNFEVCTYTGDGWDRTTVATPDDAGEPLSRVTTVENGRDEFASLFQPRSDRADDFDLPLFAYGTAWDPREN